jgi:hypothetical protein
MSKKKSPTYCFVIDASIAEAAGRCRDFLAAVRNICHRMAWSEAISAEWDRHKKGFAVQWLVSLTNLRKLRYVQDETQKELREAIEQQSKDRGTVQKMLDDAHLFEAALATDLRLASLDEKARGHFSGLSATFASLRPIMWVNPDTEGKRAVKWLEEGAKAQRSRRLRQ